MIPDEIVDVLQGADISVEIEIKQPDGTLLGELDEADMKLYLIIIDGYGTIVAKYKTGAAATGYKIIDSSELANGVIKFEMFSDVTKTLVPGKYYVEAQARSYDATRTDDNSNDLVEKEYLFSIKKSVISTLTLPA